MRRTGVSAKAAVAVAGCAAVLVGGCTGGVGAPDSPPASWPSAQVDTATFGPSPSGASTSCVVSMPDPTLHSRVDLPDDPVGADLVWFPGRYAGTPDRPEVPCRTWHTSIDKPTATALVADLKTPPARGTLSCLDSGAYVQVWFSTGRGAPSYRISLSCSLDLPSNPDHLGTWPTDMPQEPRIS